MERSLMDGRRQFMQSTLGGVAWLAVSRVAKAMPQPSARGSAVPAPACRFRVTRDAPTRLFDGQRCWCHPRAGIVPGGGRDGAPRVVMTMNTLDLSGSDVFKAMYGMHTDDLGQTWQSAEKIPALAPRYETIDGHRRPVAVSDFWPRWHSATRTLLGTGHTVVYTPQWQVKQPRPRHTAYARYDAAANTWSEWKKLAMPQDLALADCGAGCTQRWDMADGTILLPVYFRSSGKSSQVAVAVCRFDGEQLTCDHLGRAMGVDDDTRGLHEPSLTKFGDEYFLTIRNDLRGYVTRSRDGIDFEPIRVWRFDDDSLLGNYNTQQHWVTHSDGLFLVYTRRGAGNDHVFRHRAPLFIAEVDPANLRVIRRTEQILVPQRGARLGNFGVTDVSPDETWVTVAEWMQPRGADKYGSDGSIFVARIWWPVRNRSFHK